MALSSTPQAVSPLRPSKKAPIRRSAVSFSITPGAHEKLRERAAIEGLSASAMVERLIVGSDAALAFELFEAGAKHAKVVITTRMDPATVRELHEEWRAGYDPVRQQRDVLVETLRTRRAELEFETEELKREVREMEMAARETRSQRSAIVDMMMAQTRKHVAQLEANSKILGKR